jgi:uncharacterized membrane protein YcfT
LLVAKSWASTVAGALSAGCWLLAAGQVPLFVEQFSISLLPATSEFIWLGPCVSRHVVIPIRGDQPLIFRGGPGWRYQFQPALALLAPAH